MVINRRKLLHWIASEMASIAAEEWWEDDDLNARYSILAEIRDLINADFFTDDTEGVFND